MTDYFHINKDAENLTKLYSLCGIDVRYLKSRHFYWYTKDKHEWADPGIPMCPECESLLPIYLLNDK